MQTSELIKIMSNPNFYPHKPKKVEVIQTHISVVFIADPLVYKIKKAVNFGFLDFSTLEKRKYFCEREVQLNKRLSPDIYLGVEPIKLNGKILEYAVVMKKLPMERSLKNLIINKKIAESHINRVINKIAQFHLEAETNENIAIYGKTENFRKNTDENFQQTEEFIGTTIDKETFDLIKRKTEEFYKKYGKLLDERADKGLVKDCHGDLHTEHIVVTPDKVWIFDCIEFNDRFRYIDIACDIAFLLMDMEFLKRRDLSSKALELYRKQIQDEDLDIIIPFFKLYRAYVRGKVNSLMLKDPNIPEKEKEKLKNRATSYFKLAFSYLENLP